MEQAYGLLDENQKKARKNTAVAVVSDQVFEWVKSYYTLDDKAALEEKWKKAEKEFAERNKPKENKAAGRGPSKKRASKTSKEFGGRDFWKGRCQWQCGRFGKESGREKGNRGYVIGEYPDRGFTGDRAERFRERTD